MNFLNRPAAVATKTAEKGLHYLDDAGIILLLLGILCLIIVPVITAGFLIVSWLTLRALLVLIFTRKWDFFPKKPRALVNKLLDGMFGFFTGS